MHVIKEVEEKKRREEKRREEKRKEKKRKEKKRKERGKDIVMNNSRIRPSSPHSRQRDYECVRDLWCFRDGLY